MLQVHNEISRQTEKRDALLKSLNEQLKKECKKDAESEAVKLLNHQIDAIKNGGVIPEGLC